MISKEIRGSVTLLQIEHGKVNALDLELLSRLGQEFEQVEESSTRAVVLTGAGPSFSAGVDLFRLINGGRDYLNAFLPALTSALLKLFTFPKPVVAAVNGHAIAGGCVLVCACDYRLMVEGDGKIGVPELLVGVPFPALPLEILRFAVPQPNFQELVYTGRTLTPENALHHGLIEQVVKPEELLNRACDVAERFAAIPRKSFRLTKRLMRQPTLERYEKFKHSFDAEAAEIWASHEIHQTIRGYLEKTIGKRDQEKR